MHSTTNSNSIFFPLPTAFYPGCGDDISYLRALLDKGVRIFIHCDIFPNPDIYQDVYARYLSNVNAQLIAEDYNPSLIRCGIFIEEFYDYHQFIYHIDTIHRYSVGQETVNNLQMSLLGEWQIIRCIDPMTKAVFVMLMMNTDATLTLSNLYKTQNPDYITFGKVSGMDMEIDFLFYKILGRNVLNHQACMPIIYPPLNRDLSWEGYEYAHGILIPNPSFVYKLETPDTKRPVQYPLDLAIQEIFRNLKVEVIQALNMQNTRPWSITKIPIPMVLPTFSQEELTTIEKQFEINREAYFSKRNTHYSNPHESAITVVQFKMFELGLKESRMKGLDAFERICDYKTGELLCEEKYEDGAVNGCYRYYHSSKELYGEEYWKSGGVYETRIVHSKPLLTNHNAQPSIIENLEPYLSLLKMEIEGLGDAPGMNDTIQEFLNLKTHLRINVFPLTHHYRLGLKKVTTGFSAIVQLNRADGTRIAEVSYLNDRVCGCVRMFDASNNLAGEIYIYKGWIDRYNCFILPTVIVN